MPNETTFRQFRRRYEESISHLAIKTQEDWYRVADIFQVSGRVKYLADIGDKQLDRFVLAMERRKLAPTTQKAYLSKLLCALDWAKRKGMLEAPIHYRCEKLEGLKAPDSSRCVTENELAKILECVPLIRKEDAPLWDRLIRGACWSDLRLSELLNLSWEGDAKVRIVKGPEGRPSILFSTRRSQKGWKPGLHTIHPQFWEICRRNDKGEVLEEPEGFVFPMLGFNSPHAQRSRAGTYQIISDIGELSGVITDELRGKHATCHDFGRKMYASRLLSDPKISLDDARKLMRHCSIQTTLRYYDSMNHEKLGDLLGWKDSQ